MKLLKLVWLCLSLLFFVGCNETEEDNNKNGYWVLTEIHKDNRFGNWIEDSWSSDTIDYHDTIINIMKIEDDSLYIYRYLNKDTTTLFRCNLISSSAVEIEVPERLDTILFNKSYLNEHCNGTASCTADLLSSGEGDGPRIGLRVFTEKPERKNIFPYVQAIYLYDYERYSGDFLPDSWGKEIVEISEKEHYADIVQHFKNNHPY